MTDQKAPGREHINWNQVYYFSVIAECGSIKAAAEVLEVGSSNLSEQLSKLEEDLKLKLFHRQHRKLILTDDGARLFQSARQMFETGKRFIDHLTPHQMGGFTYGIGLVPAPTYSVAHRLIRLFVKHNIDVSYNIHRFNHDEMEAALLDGKIDFGFTDKRTERKNIVQSLIHTSALSFFVSSYLPKKTLAEYFLELPVLICRSERYVHSFIEEVLDDLELKPKNIILSEYPSLIESLCREGLGIAVMVRSPFEHEHNLRQIDMPDKLSPFKEVLYVSWLKGAENSEGVKRFVELLRASDHVVCSN